MIRRDPKLSLPIDQAPAAGPGRYIAASRCEAEGCNKATHERKPYCPDHVATHMPYAAAVAALVAPEPEGRAYTKVCQDCESPFRTKSARAKRCKQCKRAEVNRRSADRRAEDRKAS